MKIFSEIFIFVRNGNRISFDVDNVDLKQALMPIMLKWFVLILIATFGGSQSALYREIATNDGCVALFHVYRFDGAFVGGLLGSVFELCRDFIDKNGSDIVAHGKYLRTIADAKTA